MGSTFGKVRKYNLNSTDAANLKYNVTSEDESKPSLDHKDLFTRYQTTSLRDRVERSNSKLKTSNVNLEMFESGYPPQPIPEYYNLNSTEEIFLHENISKNSSNTFNVEGDYITLKQGLQTTPIPPSDTNPPPLPPRNKGYSNRFDQFINKPKINVNTNPVPHQKVYSAEDIDRLLRPLNLQSDFARRAVIQSNEQIYPVRHSYNLTQPTRYYTCPHICECHKINAARIYHDFISPPPYNFVKYSHDTGQMNQNVIHVQRPSYNYQIEDVHPQNHPTTPREYVIHPKYNTVHIDRAINSHRHNINWSTRHHAPSQPGYSHIAAKPTEPTSQEQDQTKIKRNNSSFKEETFHSLRHKRDSLHQTEMLNQEFRREPISYRSLRAEPCYTIPEEGSWLPPFHYHPAVYHPHRRSFHQ